MLISWGIGVGECGVFTVNHRCSLSQNAEPAGSAMRDGCIQRLVCKLLMEKLDGEGLVSGGVY